MRTIKAPLQTAVVCAVVFVCGNVPCVGQAMNIINPLLKKGIVVYPPSSKEFSDTLAKLVQPGDLEKVRPLLPFCVVVKNSTGVYLAGLTVIFRAPDVIMPSGKPYRSLVASRTAVRDRSQMFAPGASRLVSPVGPVQGTLHVDGTPGLQPLFDDATQQMIALFMASYGTRHFDVLIDSLITEDGFLEGPDESRQLQEFNTKLRAEWDVRDHIAGLHGDDLRKAITTLKQDSGGEQGDTEYARLVHAYSAGLLEYLDLVGEAQFLSVLEQVKDFREIKRSLQ